MEMMDGPMAGTDRQFVRGGDRLREIGLGSRDCHLRCSALGKLCGKGSRRF